MLTRFTRVSRNAKTGPIPVSTTSSDTCPVSCPLKGSGCYAESGPLAIVWKETDSGRHGMEFEDFLRQVRALPKGQLWRHNQAGDLPGKGDSLDYGKLASLVRANKGRRGFTYTHKPVTDETAPAIAAANANGFTVNLSADNLARADQLAETGVGPIVCVLPADQTRATRTPGGRHVAVCPATLSDKVTCASCGLCADPARKSIIGFPAHGSAKAAASRIASNVSTKE